MMLVSYPKTINSVFPSGSEKHQRSGTLVMPDSRCTEGLTLDVRMVTVRDHRGAVRHIPEVAWRIV